MVFIDRSPERPVRFLEWRVRLFGAGAILAVAGMAAEMGWLIWIAIVVLLVGFLLRFVPVPDESEPAGRSGTLGEADPDPHSGDTPGEAPR